VTYAEWRERFLDAVDQDLYPAGWLDKRVAAGRARFWGNNEAAILAEIRAYPSGVREVHGLVAAGDLGSIKALIPLAEAWGRKCGATRASISSHPAWAKLMRHDGYEPAQLTIVKEL
jgi:hypothetical protein